MKNTLIITEHEEIKVATIRDIGKRIISKEDKELLFSIIHKDKNGEERYVFSRKGKNGIKSNSMVGSISIKNGLIIEILPKFAKGDLTEENIKRYRETLIGMIRVSREKNFRYSVFFFLGNKNFRSGILRVFQNLKTYGIVILSHKFPLTG